MMVASVKGEVIYPVVVVLVDGIKIRALLDTGSGSNGETFGATVKRHLESLKERYPNEVAEIEKSLYIDDVITGGGETLKTKSLI
jgi:hypothetical protein